MFPPLRRRSAGCCGSCGTCFVFVVLGIFSKLSEVWYNLMYINGKCKHPENPDGSSGLKVIVASFAKSGTRTMSHALNYLGVRTYHSEDLDLFSYREYGDIMRTKPEYKNMIQGEILGPIWYDPFARDQFMRALSRCRADSVALDGTEHLFWPLYHASPDVKVILLDWRKYQQWYKSLTSYGPKLLVMVLFNVFQDGMAGLVPWMGVVRLVDWLAGGRWVANVLEEGGPPPTEVSGPLASYYQAHFIFTFHVMTFMPFPPFGASEVPTSEMEYDSWLKEIREGVPEDRLYAWDPKKTTYEDLCSFLDIHPCPRKGLLRKARNTWLWERDFPVSTVVVGNLRYFEIWCNWRLFCGAKRLLWRLITSRCRKVKTG